MASEMTRWERLRAALKGQDVDRVPVSMWRHFFAKETSAESLAEAMIGFQSRFDWDFMKVNPRASYHVEDWGAPAHFPVITTFSGVVELEFEAMGIIWLSVAILLMVTVHITASCLPG